MKATREAGSRSIHVTELPATHGHGLTELTIEVRYKGRGGAREGIALDNDILPAIVDGINAPKAKPYSQMTREEAERAVDEAETVLRAEYWQDVRALADSIGADLRERLSEGEDGENLREWLIEYIEQSIDGHHNVIYTRAAQKVILYSDHSGAYADEFGEEGIVENGDISWSRLAYAAMRADVIEQLDANGIDVNEPDSQSTKDSLGIETDEDEDEE